MMHGQKNNILIIFVSSWKQLKWTSVWRELFCCRTSPATWGIQV